MSRPLRSTALVSLLVTLACANAPEAGSGESTTMAGQAGQAGSSGTAPPNADTPTTPGAERAVPNRQIAAYVPVASAPAEARPCERMCGLVGDCLLEGGDASDAGHLRETFHLELACLDLCVNVAPSSEAGKRFRACESHDACGPLLDCTRKDWDGAAKARGAVTTQIDAAPQFDVCQLMCGSLYACAHFDRPLHLLTERNDAFDREVANCLMECDPNQESIATFAACAGQDTCDQQWDCWRNAQPY